MHREKRHILLDAAARGGLWTRLSFLIMGAGCIRYKQFVRGAAYLLSEIGFIFFFRDFAMQYLSKFATLGTETQRKVWNEEQQIFQRFPGDNSMLILLFSVLSIAVCAVFLYLWFQHPGRVARAGEHRARLRDRFLPGRSPRHAAREIPCDAARAPDAHNGPLHGAADRLYDPHCLHEL